MQVEVKKLFGVLFSMGNLLKFFKGWIDSSRKLRIFPILLGVLVGVLVGGFVRSRRLTATPT
jgi:hypothetical protein